MTILQTIAVAFAMFSALPVPQFEWNEKNMRYAMCAFPLIGLVCGGLWCLCGVLPLPGLARAAAFILSDLAGAMALLSHMGPVRSGGARLAPTKEINNEGDHNNGE